MGPGDVVSGQRPVTTGLRTSAPPRHDPCSPAGPCAGSRARARPTSAASPSRRCSLPPPSDADIAALLTRLRRRVRRLLVRRGRLAEEAQGRDPFVAQEPRFAQTVAASLQGRVALGSRAGQPLRRLRSAAAATSTGPRGARLEGFSLHAGRGRAGASARSPRTPGPLPRASAAGAGAVDGEHRRAAALPRPTPLERRLHRAAPRAVGVAGAARGARAPAAPAVAGGPWRPRPACPMAIGDHPEAGPCRRERGRRRALPGRWPWARLLRRVFAIQVLGCERCGGARRILGAVTEPPAVRRGLTALGLAAEPPPGAARPGRLTRARSRPHAAPGSPSVRRP